ncbi:hypothetical protein CENSYa_1295 [Cenarchaeum symbiosum A]|uniref:Uncharacterized protein n=1 Tax=Cenarchaeum symbiosum (strain A) TaxID=414004 RepID=A0RX51_CENSY|nr:hypothetical protein CENSYa_1295 [Cenarchaeum symbiosum A]
MKLRHVRMTEIKKGAVMRWFDKSVFEHVSKEIAVFLCGYKKNMSDFVFECDSDSRYFVSGKGGKCTKPGIVHELADIIAWSYVRKRKLKCVNYRDKTAELLSTLEQIVSKV